MVVFDFTSFAEEIYSDSPKIYPIPMSLRSQANAGKDTTLNPDDVPIAVQERFLLPALYGGKEGKTFEALVVLEAPSVPFTREEWRTWTAPCASCAEAIERHRRIFYKWAFAEKRPAKLFSGLLKGKPETVEQFFQRLYITDMWKDAAWINEPQYVQYWQSKLEKEIRGVATKDVIFVGKSAHQYGERCVPKDKRCHHVPFPTRRNKNFDTELQRLLEDFHNARSRDAKIAELKAEIAELEAEIKARAGMTENLGLDPL